jgi:polar amino acid transport system substrate-binding protein
MKPPITRGTWGGAGRWLRAMLAGSVLLSSACAVHAQAQPMLVLGTSRPDNTYVGRLLRRTYQELFSRVGVPLEIRTTPSARLSMELASDRLDGDVARPLAFAESQPSLVRVDEPILSIGFALWAVHPKYTLQRLDQLAGSGWSVNFTRGVVECERLLQTLLPASRVVDVTTTLNALNLLHHGRNDLHCGIDLAVLSDAGSPEMAGLPPPLKVLNIGDPLPLYFYLQRKHAALVPQLDVTLKKMKAEGLLEQYRREAMQEFKLLPPPKPATTGR